MKEMNYWEQFIHTGSVEDYLRFKDADDTIVKNESDTVKQTGENPYAGVRNRYRNCT